MNRFAFSSLISLTLGALIPLGHAAPLDADAARGGSFFQTQMCVNCHAIRGAGGTQAPDLGQRYDRDYTPAGIAARMWNHAPVMWAAMSRQKIAVPRINEDQAADLFAFFYSVRYFEKPGEAERGKRVFEGKHCSECHSLTAAGRKVGTPVEGWGSLTDPIALADRMWDHGAKMRAEMAQRNIPYPQLSAQELDDLMVYLQNLPQTRNAKLEFSLPSPEGGAGLFEQKGCSGCHKGAMSLENKLSDATLTDVAAAMWNHAPLMQQPPPDLSLAEMRQILGYIWGRQFFQTHGDAERGKKAFDQKKCASCHNDASSGAPALSKPAKPYTTIAMITVLWGHGPSMLSKMQERRVSWPQLSAADMANLIAYLNSR